MFPAHPIVFLCGAFAAIACAAFGQAQTNHTTQDTLAESGLARVLAADFQDAAANVSRQETVYRFTTAENKLLPSADEDLNTPSFGAPSNTAEDFAPDEAASITLNFPDMKIVSRHAEGLYTPTATVCELTHCEEIEGIVVEGFSAPDASVYGETGNPHIEYTTLTHTETAILRVSMFAIPEADATVVGIGLCALLAAARRARR